MLLAEEDRAYSLRHLGSVRPPQILLLDRLKDFAVVPFSAGGNSSLEQHSQSTEERAILDRHHHSHGHSGMCAG